MDIDKSAQEAAQWKKKYFNQLEETESKERQWKDAEDLLRKTISRLTLAADGLDDTLDRHLRELRNVIRDRATTAVLRSRIDDMSQALVHLDAVRKKREHESKDEPLLDLLDALSLPKGTGRQSKALKKQLRSTSKDDPQAAVRSFAALIHSALELSGDESSQATVQEGKSGLLKRLFQAKEEQQALASAESDETLVSAAAPARTIDSVREILIQLLERLSLPGELLDRIGSIRARIEAIREGDSWDRVLEEIADLVQEIRVQSQKEKQGIEDFLKQLTERLQEVDRQLQESEQYYDDSLDSGEQLGAVVKKEISGIENSVREADDLVQLKRLVQVHIDTVLAHLDKHRETEQHRYNEAKKQIEVMNERLHHMSEETEKLRSRLSMERNQAMTDVLTGIPNRLAYEERLEQEIARWKRFGTLLVLVVWDIDHFKKVNDSFGHKAGDKVLRNIAQVLAKGVRETDFVARYGGEEFVQLMTGSSLRNCLPVAEKLRAEIEATGFHFRDQAVTITASCGLAELRKGDSIEQWFERADKALYRAKQEGRNRCKTAP